MVLDGEIVRKLKPVFGYLHRNHEKIGENTSYLGSMPYTDRLDYFCSMTNNWAYALSVEKLAGIEVPERAEYMRVILAELTRLQNHASLLGFLLSDMGAWGTPLMYAFREREKILDLFESLAGSRMMCNYMRFGGCRVDAGDEWLARAKQIVDRFPKFLDEFEELILGNEIVIGRTQDVGNCPPNWRSTPASPVRCCARAASITTFAKWTATGFIRDSNSACRSASTAMLTIANDAGVGDARERGDPEAGVRANSSRPDHGSESENARISSAGWRSVRPNRRAKGRARILFDQRRHPKSISLPRSPAELHQSDDA